MGFDRIGSPDHCLYFNFAIVHNESKLGNYGECVFSETVA